MKDPIQKYFYIGTIQWMTHPPMKYKLLDSIKTLVADEFFTAVEITKIEDEATRKKVRKMLEQSHMKVCYGAQPRILGPKLNPNDMDEEERLKAELTLIEAIDEAEQMGAKGIAFLAGKWNEKTKDEAYGQLLKTTRNLCSYAGKKGMMVELEVFDYDMDKAVLIGPAPYAAKFAADMRSTHSNFGLLVDLSHFPTTYEDSRFVIQTLRPYITHFHIGNAVLYRESPAYGDQHPRFGYPAGQNDEAEVAAFLRILQTEGFLDKRLRLPLSFEVKPRKEESADIILCNCKRTLNSAWRRLNGDWE